MKSITNEESNFNPNLLLTENNIIDFKSYSDNLLRNRYKIDENEKKFQDFINSKLEAMEKIKLDDENLIESQIEKIKIDSGEKLFPRSELSKGKKSRNSIKKIKSKKNTLKKNSKNERNNKNKIINHKGKVKKTNIESIDSVDIINLDIDKEIKKKELNQFFSSNKTLLNSIINEMKEN